MKFITYLPEIMLEIMDSTDIILQNEDYILYKNGDSTFLAVQIPNTEPKKCAQYEWRDFVNVDGNQVEQIINNKVEETIKIFKETLGLISTLHPTTILKEVSDILKFNSCEASLHNTEQIGTILSSSQISLEQDFCNGIWIVKVANHKYCLANEKTARRVYALIKKDIDNFIKSRW